MVNSRLMHKQSLPFEYRTIPILPYFLPFKIRTHHDSGSPLNFNLSNPQHYSKVHAHRHFSCDICGTGFPTDIYLKRHKKTSCGKKFSCLTCSKSYGAIENLKVGAKQFMKQNRLFLQKNTISIQILDILAGLLGS